MTPPENVVIQFFYIITLLSNSIYYPTDTPTYHLLTPLLTPLLRTLVTTLLTTLGKGSSQIITLFSSLAYIFTPT